MKKEEIFIPLWNDIGQDSQHKITMAAFSVRIERTNEQKYKNEQTERARAEQANKTILNGCLCKFHALFPVKSIRRSGRKKQPQYEMLE